MPPGPDGNWDAGRIQMLEGWATGWRSTVKLFTAHSPLAPYKEGKVCLTQGKDGTVYMIYLADENETTPPAKIWFSSLFIPEGAQAMMLGTKERPGMGKGGERNYGEYSGVIAKETSMRIRLGDADF